MHNTEFTRFFLAAVYALAGVFFLWKRPSITTLYGCSVFDKVCVDEAVRARLKNALRHRIDLDQSQPIYNWLFVLSYFVLAALLFAGAVPTTLGIAIFAAVNGFLLAVAYLRLLRKPAPRAALLTPRSVLGGVPWWMFAIGLVAALSPWTYFSGEPAVAVVIFAASWSLLFAAVGMAQAPSMITGGDVAVERFVDDRVRTYHALTLLSYSAIPPWIFANFDVTQGSFVRLIVWIITLLAWTAPLAWVIRIFSQPPDSRSYPELQRSAF